MIASNSDITIDVNLIQEQAYNSPSGCESLFVKLNDSIGIKLYYDDKVRDRCYIRQTNASAYGLGPQTYGKVENLNVKASRYQSTDGKPMYDGLESSFECGYLTEVVKPLGDNRDFSNEDFYDENIGDLRQQLKNCINFSFGDDHPGNCGIDKHGNLVCIDFGA